LNAGVGVEAVERVIMADKLEVAVSMRQNQLPILLVLLLTEYKLEQAEQGV
jgi:hypothetical protein